LTEKNQSLKIWCYCPFKHDYGQDFVSRCPMLRSRAWFFRFSFFPGGLIFFRPFKGTSMICPPMLCPRIFHPCMIQPCTSLHPPYVSSLKDPGCSKRPFHERYDSVCFISNRKGLVFKLCSLFFSVEKTKNT
jgi:hypothetical protein